MTYGLNRALPMTILGFILGAGFVILLRGLQQMDEIWHPQIGLIVGGVVATVFFFWGIGGLSPALAEHHVPEPEEDEFGNEIPVEAHHHDEETPTSILTGTVWTVSFWTMVLFAALLFFAALPGGFGYTVSLDAAANANANGFFALQLAGGQTIFVSKIVAFAVFFAITMFSLYIAALLIARAFAGMSHGLKEVKAAGDQPLTPLLSMSSGSAVAALPSGEGEAVAVPAAPSRRVRKPVNPGAFGWMRWRTAQLLAFIKAMLLDEPTPAHRRSTGERLRKLAILFGTMAVLYVIFWEAAIGWIFPQPFLMRFVLSISNAILIPLLILRFRWILHIIGVVARFSARVMRGIPTFLFQRD